MSVQHLKLLFNTFFDASHHESIKRIKIYPNRFLVFDAMQDIGITIQILHRVLKGF